MSLPPNAFKQGLKGPARLLGVWAMSGSPVVAEALGCVGYDFVVLDMEHGPNDVPRALGLLQAMAGTAAAPVVRLPWNDAVVVKQVLDCGAQSLMFPYIQSAEDAGRAVAATRYAPHGLRGVAGMSRATRFGGVKDYFTRAAGELCTILQIETGEALARLPEIAAVPGVDSLFVGPNDLAASLGHIGRTDHSDVRKALVAASAACREAGKPCGILAPSIEVAGEYLGYGYDWIAVGSDLGLMMAAARQSVASLRAQG